MLRKLKEMVSAQLHLWRVRRKYRAMKRDLYDSVEKRK